MDISFKTEEGRFNYRVCAVIINEDRLLVMHDERSPYYYLPGGRVKLYETAEGAVLREIREELEVDATIIRPLWLNQAYFTQDVNGERYHELCIYFLIDVSKTSILDKGNKFSMHENNHTYDYEWLEFNRLEEEYIYPEFIKKQIFNLPDSLTLQIET